MYHRGANSPLLHCGVGEDWSEIRLVFHRGANSPLLHCGEPKTRLVSLTLAHRGANSPLLHCGVEITGAIAALTVHTEGRIRPSYIAAFLLLFYEGHQPSHRGANSPLLHCGCYQFMDAWTDGLHRGANSPLLHCGMTSPFDSPVRVRTPRGEFAPPTLRRFGLCCALRPFGAPRGEFAPPTLRPDEDPAEAGGVAATEGRIRPSYIAAETVIHTPSPPAPHRGANSPLLHCGEDGRVVETQYTQHRGANSPLLHCGRCSGAAGSRTPLPPRGEFAPPTLRPTHHHLGQRRIRAPRGEFAPPTLRQVRRRQDAAACSAPRGEFAPPTLRPVCCEELYPRSDAPRGEFAPPTLRLEGIDDDDLVASSPRGEFAPPTLRRPRCRFGCTSLLRTEGRIRPSYIAAVCQ